MFFLFFLPKEISLSPNLTADLSLIFVFVCVRTQENWKREWESVMTVCLSVMWDRGKSLTAWESSFSFISGGLACCHKEICRLKQVSITERERERKKSEMCENSISYLKQQQMTQERILCSSVIFQTSYRVCRKEIWKWNKVLIIYCMADLQSWFCHKSSTVPEMLTCKLELREDLKQT